MLAYFLALLPAVLALPQSFKEGPPAPAYPAVCYSELCCQSSFSGGVPDPKATVGNVFNKRQSGEIAPGDSWGFPGVHGYGGTDFDGYPFCKKCREEGHCKTFTINSD